MGENQLILVTNKILVILTQHGFEQVLVPSNLLNRN